MTTVSTQAGIDIPVTYIAGMFVLELTYTAPMEQVNAAHDAHMEWVERHWEAGHFIASGRKVPRDGGILLSAVPDRATAEKIVAEDPFVTAGVCEYRITEFIATRTAPGMEAYRQEPTA